MAQMVQPNATLPNAEPDPPLPHGVRLRRLEVHGDERGWIAEFYRWEWPTGIEPLQWQATSSEAGVMRGVHLHPAHDDYLVVLHGAVLLGLHDLRPGSPTARRSAMLELGGDRPVAVLIPHGVAHGLLCRERSVFLLGNSHYYDTADELGCHWRDPALGLHWPTERVHLSARDAALPPMHELAKRVRPWQPE